jgi:bla regulator protein BlaR1
LVDERERACDEAVIRWGCEPQVYAESIVKMCEVCIASPFCVAGVTGSDLTRRVEAIMRNLATEPVTRWRQLVLVTVAAVAWVGPIAVGVLSGPELQAQSSPAADERRVPFGVASVKPGTSGNRLVGEDANARISEQAGGICSAWGWIQPTDTCFRASNTSLRELITYAFSPRGLVPPRSPVVGGPSWIDVDRFDIVARAAGSALFDPFSRAQLAPMVRTLLADRFKLTLHHESRALPVYVLRFTRADRTIGPQLRPATSECVAKITAFHAGLSNGSPMSAHDPCVVESSPGYVKGGGIDMAQLAWTLSNRFNRVVRDETGLIGFFAIDLAWPAGSDSNVQALATALRDELGLTLEATTGPVDVLVIDHAEPPTLD